VAGPGPAAVGGTAVRGAIEPAAAGT